MSGTQRRAWLRCAVALVAALGGTTGSGCKRARTVGAQASSVGAQGASALSGLYWGRVGDVPDGMRVQVWLEGLSDGRVRGGYEAVPWSGDLEGVRRRDGALALTLRERGFSAEVGARG